MRFCITTSLIERDRTESQANRRGNSFSKTRNVTQCSQTIVDSSAKVKNRTLIKDFQRFCNLNKSCYRLKKWLLDTKQNGNHQAKFHVILIFKCSRVFFMGLRRRKTFMSVYFYAAPLTILSLTRNVVSHDMKRPLSIR